MNSECNPSLFSTPEMTKTFSLLRQLRAMMRFEWALSCALEKYGFAVPGAGASLERLLDASYIDIDELLRDAPASGNIAIPFVNQLTAELKRNNEASAWSVHLGATSQDVLDTALVLQMKEGIGIILAAMGRLETALTAQVKTHAETIMAGRTWLQPGPPITLGLKLAGTLAALRRHRSRIEAASERAFVVQFGGAVGTLAALGDMGSEVSTELARLLELDEPELPWHTQRDNLVEVAAVLALLAGSLGKLAKDIALLMQAEVGEASEPAAEGRGGSSTMPQKRNPVACAAILVGAARIPGLVSTLLTAMPQEHERGLGLWQTEWETLPEIFRLTALALAQSIEIAEGLEVDAVRMTSNLNAMLGLAQSEGISAALAPLIGRSAAYEILRKATLEARTRQVHLAEILESIPAVTAHLSSAKIKRLLQPREYLGSTQRFIGRVLGEHDANR